MIGDCRHQLRIFLATSLWLFFGCGKQQPKLPDTVKFTGVVTLDGKALEGGTVRFVPQSDNGLPGAIGVCDGTGKYELRTEIGDGKFSEGVIPGPYHVYVSRLVRRDGSLVPPDSMEPPMMSGARDSIPAKYGTDEGRLSYVVPAAGGTFEIKLDSKSVSSGAGSGGFGPGGPAGGRPGPGRMPAGPGR